MCVYVLALVVAVVFNDLAIATLYGYARVVSSVVKAIYAQTRHFVNTGLLF